MGAHVLQVSVECTTPESENPRDGLASARVAASCMGWVLTAKGVRASFFVRGRNTATAASSLVSVANWTGWGTDACAGTCCTGSVLISTALWVAGMGTGMLKVISTTGFGGAELKLNSTTGFAGPREAGSE